jgi:hypothetical protein
MNMVGSTDCSHPTPAGNRPMCANHQNSPPARSQSTRAGAGPPKKNAHGQLPNAARLTNATTDNGNVDDETVSPLLSQRQHVHATHCCSCSHQATCTRTVARGAAQACACAMAGRPCTSCLCITTGCRQRLPAMTPNPMSGLLTLGFTCRPPPTTPLPQLTTSPDPPRHQPSYHNANHLPNTTTRDPANSPRNNNRRRNTIPTRTPNPDADDTEVLENPISP